MAVSKVDDLVARLGLNEVDLNSPQFKDELLAHLPGHLAREFSNYLNSENKTRLQFSLYEHVDANNKTPFLPEFDDLLRLHHLVRTRKCLNVLEFGLGYSTLFISIGISLNSKQHASKTCDIIRRQRPYSHFAVDSNRNWIRHFRKVHLKYSSPEVKEVININFSRVHMGSFNGKICTFYETIPNICPDLIYLDGPDQFSPKGEISGISTRSPDRMPMAADILRFEHFLQPGTLLIIDGRAANARFLACNLQRNWIYQYYDDADQHIFLLDEEALGIFNANLIAHINS